MYITTSEELEKFCNDIAHNDYISIDTEFIRKNTYFPNLCLVQISAGKKNALIDPLSKLLDLSIIDQLLQNPKITKILHSAKQDLENFYILTGKLPKNIFDTQVAAGLCGLGASISYESLVEKMLRKKIDKSHCVSDWSIRPLAKAQLDYAIADVTYLYQIYPKLLKSIKAKKRITWLEEEMDNLNQVDNLIVNPKQAWRKLKNLQKYPITSIVKELAAWRELKAKNANIPRNHYLDESHLFTLAKVKPINLNELRNIPYFNKIADIKGEAIINVICQALDQQLEHDLTNNNTNYSKINIELLKELKKLLIVQADKYAITSTIIASTEELKKLCILDKTLPLNSKVLNGWRRDVFGDLALQLRTEFFS